MRAYNVTFGLVTLLFAAGTAAGTGVVYVSYSTVAGSGCVDVLGSGTWPVDPSADDCPEPDSGGSEDSATRPHVVEYDPTILQELLDLVVGAEYGPVSQCWVVGAGVPHPCDFGGLPELEEILDVGGGVIVIVVPDDVAGRLIGARALA